MLEKKLERREFLRSALTVGAGSVLGAGLATACAPTPTAPAAPVAEEVVAPTEAPAVEAPTEAPAEAPAVAEDKRDINVCGIFPISGFIAADGIEMRNGVVMAIDEINEMGGLVGHKLNYIEVDDVDSVGDQVTTAFQRAIDVEKADVIFSGYHLTSAPEFTSAPTLVCCTTTTTPRRPGPIVMPATPRSTGPSSRPTLTTSGTAVASPGT